MQNAHLRWCIRAFMRRSSQRHLGLFWSASAALAFNVGFSMRPWPSGQAVFVEAPARLHFGVLDLRGALGRWFGGIGAAAPAPAVLVFAHPADTVEGGGGGAGPAARLRPGV